MDTVSVALGSMHLPLLVSSPPALRDPRTRTSKLSLNLQKEPRLSQETQDLQAQVSTLTPMGKALRQVETSVRSPRSCLCFRGD